MKISLYNKIVVVTGAAKGIGAAIASLFHEAEATIILLDISDEGKDLAHKMGGKARFHL